ncbi:hypothetical protein P691DRAFT_774042 [Macrolepiota fuliginosa MF-IS2]|uniref:F-box domain-containing protein n=1 Tax=Macrolepiota fuliginosa MF-IS2 TaxID=1400762 RepID=A0A9P6C3N8_9AGAR|nr:hypothetical protein P691DRAFT_774042 [Macrolepiota fuliginosa MF-IS2]
MPPAFHNKLRKAKDGLDTSYQCPATPIHPVPSHTTLTKHIKRCSLLILRRSTKIQLKPPKLATDILPTELWLKVLRYALRLTGAQAIDLKDPFQSEYHQEDYPNTHPGYFEDRRSCRRVCRVFNTLVTEIMMEYIVIHTQAELEWTVTTLEADCLRTEHKRLGEWTTRIDFCINRSYDPEWMLRLLTLTPNLLIYTTNTGCAEYPEHSMNVTILQALIDFHSKTLKRLDWAGLNEAPTYADLHAIGKNFTKLSTLHLRHLYSLPAQNVRQPMLVFHSLKSLSLGLIPLNRPLDVAEELFPFRWDMFLMYLIARPFQLAKLERFDVDICPIPEFFSVCGHNIKTFRTTSWSTQDCVESAFEMLPNLRTFLYGYHAAPDCHLPLQHPTLERIGVTPLIEHYIEVPPTTYHQCIVKPLDSLLANVEDMDAKKLTDVRICDRGAFTGIFEQDDCLFWHWRQRLRDRKNVRLQNKFGDLDLRYVKYGDRPPPKQPTTYKLTLDRPTLGLLVMDATSPITQGGS